MRLKRQPFTCLCDEKKEKLQIVNNKFQTISTIAQEYYNQAVQISILMTGQPMRGKEHTVNEAYLDWCAKYFGITFSSNNFGWRTRQDRPWGIHEIIWDSSGMESILCNFAGKVELKLGPLLVLLSFFFDFMFILLFFKFGSGINERGFCIFKLLVCYLCLITERTTRLLQNSIYFLF